MRALGLGLLAAAGSAVSAQEDNRSDVFCRVVSASRTDIQTQDGYAEALVDIAESICNEATGSGEPQVITIEESITAVASAQAKAVAEVVSTCTGVGSATLSVEARRRAEARATAVGTASASILATAGVCGLCETLLQSLVTAVEMLTVDAVAEVNLDAEFTFTGEPLTVSVVENTVETEVANLLSSITAEVRLSGSEGCSINSGIIARTPSNVAICDVSVKADDIITQIDATVNAGLEVQAFGCDGVDSFQRVQLRLREVAVAVAESVTQSDVFCEASGGPGTTACGLTNGTINSIATAHVEAFAQGSAVASGEDCDCELAPRLRSDEKIATIIAESTASSLIAICTEGEAVVSITLTQSAVEENVAEALAEVFIETFVGVEECAVNLGIVAAINPTSDA